MDKKKLKRELDRLGINPSIYCLDGSKSDDVYTVEGQGDAWGVFYYEKGVQHIVRFFDSENEACHALLEELKSEPSYYLAALSKRPRWLRKTDP